VTDNNYAEIKFKRESFSHKDNGD